MYLCPSFVGWALFTTHAVYWRLLTALVRLVLANAGRAAAVACGVLLATSLLAAPAAVFLALSWLRSAGKKKTLHRCAVAATLAAAILAPFLLWDRTASLLGVLHWHNDLHLAPAAGWKFGQIWADQVGVR